MKNIKSEYVWTINNNDRITEPDIKIIKSWENIVNQIIYNLEHSRGFDVKKKILNNYLRKDILNWFTMNEQKKEIRISPVPGYYGSYVILRKEKKHKSEINFDEFKPSKTLVDRYSQVINFDDKISKNYKIKKIIATADMIEYQKLAPEIDYNDFIIDALEPDSIPFLINGDFKISLKLRILMCDYLNDIKKNLPDDIFDSEREVIHNFYLWVKKKYR